MILPTVAENATVDKTSQHVDNVVHFVKTTILNKIAGNAQDKEQGK